MNSWGKILRNGVNFKKIITSNKIVQMRFLTPNRILLTPNLRVNLDFGRFIDLFFDEMHYFSIY
jgi:hypothetical protein